LPIIEDLLRTGPLTKAERRVLEAVDMHIGCVWSDSLEDLCEMARYSEAPKMAACPFLVIEGDLRKDARSVPGMTINDKVQCQVDGNVVPTYTLRTISNALDRLARTKRIWAFELHGRKHYGSYGGKPRVLDSIKKLPEEQRDEAGFKEEFTFSDKNVNKGSA
jgi:hypothetical protein